MRIVLGLVSIVSTMAAGQQATEREVEVYIPIVASRTLDLPLMQARGLTSRIYRDAGIALRWKQAQTGVECSRRPVRVAIQFSTRTALDFHPGALAYALPYADGGVCVTVFLDRIEPMAMANPTSTVHLLGHVLAHEIGHYLQGIERHSEEGIMKPSWTKREIREMAASPQRFSDYDRSLLEQVVARKERSR